MRSRSTTSPPTATASPARRSRRSTSPTRSRAASTRTRTYYLSHTLQPGWLAGYPNYEVKTFEGSSLNKSINLVQATLDLRQHRLRPAGRRPRRGIDHPDGLQDGRQNAPQQLPRGGARRAHARRHAAGNGRRVRDARRRRLAQHADRDHQGRLPRRPRRQQLGQAAPRQGAQRSGRPPRRRASSSRTSTAAPPGARRSTARRPPRPARPANWSTPGSTATRRTTRRSSGWATRTSASR